MRLTLLSIITAVALGSGVLVSISTAETPNTGYAIASDGAKIYYEAHGSGPVVFLGQHLYASDAKSIGFKQGYLDQLTDSYTVLLYDPRGFGKTRQANEGEDLYDGIGTSSCIISDILAVADALEAEKFAWSGYSWGGAVGMRLATDTDRLSALLVGGWPAYGGGYHKDFYQLAAGMIDQAEEQLKSPDIDVATRALLEEAVEFGPMVKEFYWDYQSWDEDSLVPLIDIPRLQYVAGEDAIPMLKDRAQKYESKLTSFGWSVVWLPDVGHMVHEDPSIVAPVLRSFLDGHRDELVAASQAQFVGNSPGTKFTCSRS